jgi:hypothetical protein
MLNWKAIHGTEPMPEGKPTLVFIPGDPRSEEAHEQNDRTAVVYRRGVNLYLDATGERLQYPATLWTDQPELPFAARASIDPKLQCG